ncbi:MAG: site-specific integrase [Gemmatimonadetes bacterium]|nr:site-specific integrase [Gemmatimonadota bacterium]
MSHALKTSELTRRLYERNGHWYVDLRAYGAGRIALAANGSSRATTDYDEALTLGGTELRQAKADAAELRDRRVARFKTVGEVAHEFEEQLATNAAKGLVRESTRTRYLLALRQLLGTTDERQRPRVAALDQDRRIDRLTVDDVRASLKVLNARVTRRGGPLSASSIHHILVVLHYLCAMARSAGCAPSGFDPCRDLTAWEKPKMSRDREPTDFLEVPEVRALLATIQQEYTGPLPLYEIAATLLYTGGRKTEVLGLLVSDLDFPRELVRFRRNQYRRIKRDQDRPVPFVRELRDILRAYLTRTGRVGGLVFPPPHDPAATHLITTDLIAPLREAQCAAVLRLPEGEREAFATKRIHPHAFRTTYCSARLQTLDNGAAVSPFTVCRELGHKSMQMVLRVYGNLGNVRQRGDEVSY